MIVNGIRAAYSIDGRMWPGRYAWRAYRHRRKRLEWTGSTQSPTNGEVAGDTCQLPPLRGTPGTRQPQRTLRPLPGRRTRPAHRTPGRAATLLGPPTGTRRTGPTPPGTPHPGLPAPPLPRSAAADPVRGRRMARHHPGPTQPDRERPRTDPPGPPNPLGRPCCTSPNNCSGSDCPASRPPARLTGMRTPNRRLVWRRLRSKEVAPRNAADSTPWQRSLAWAEAT